MANYFARVELHGARWPEDYAVLHNALAKHGFTNCVSANDGRNLKLPTGFYYSTDRIDDNSIVAKAVKECANSTGYNNEVIVINSNGWYSFLNYLC
jgi:hypothetical protein